MVGDHIRRAMIAHPKLVRRVILTGQQLRVLDYCILRLEIQTPEIAKAFNMSLSHASGILVKLTEKGYMKRTKGVSPSGGPIFTYKVRGRVY